MVDGYQWRSEHEFVGLEVDRQSFVADLCRNMKKFRASAGDVFSLVSLVVLLLEEMNRPRFDEKVLVDDCTQFGRQVEKMADV